jgi:hypothetical protein
MEEVTLLFVKPIMPVGRVLNDRRGREHGQGHKHQHRMDLNAGVDNVHDHDHVRVHV